jgi:hypothetical protein
VRDNPLTLAPTIVSPVNMAAHARRRKRRSEEIAAIWMTNRCSVARPEQGPPQTPRVVSLPGDQNAIVAHLRHVSEERMA